jgi:hypothetical protein
MPVLRGVGNDRRQTTPLVHLDDACACPNVKFTPKLYAKSGMRISMNAGSEGEWVHEVFDHL